MKADMTSPVFDSSHFWGFFADLNVTARPHHSKLQLLRQDEYSSSCSTDHKTQHHIHLFVAPGSMPLPLAYSVWV